MQNLKNNTNESVYKSETDSQTQKANYGYQRGKKGWSGKLVVWDLQIQITIHKIGKQQGFTVQHRELYSVSCNNL